MDHLIGQRFTLISKSEIRYIGTLHEINPEKSTIALEDVYSFGTEDRKADSFMPPSQVKFDYIVFRGSDVKDIKIAEEQNETKQPSPPSMPNDPAILNASRPGPPLTQQGPPPHRDHSPFHPPGYPPPPQFGSYYPQQQPQYGPGFRPPPGQFGPGPGQFHGMHPYGPPPPGYFGPPQGQDFPGGSSGPFSPIPIGPPGQRAAQQPGLPQGHQQQDQPTSELPVENKNVEKSRSKSATPVPAIVPTAPVSDPKPNATDSTVSTEKLVKKAPLTMAAVVAKPAPAAPKSNRVTPAVPMTVNQKSFIPPPTSNGPSSNLPGDQPVAKQAPSAVSMEEASRQAKEAVAAAMAKLNPGAATATKPAGPSNHFMESLNKKASEMRIGPGPVPRGRGNFRGGRGAIRSGSGGQQAKKLEIPKDDYDFESANAKFNKEDLVKEAIASSSPLGETAEDGANGGAEEININGEKRKESLPLPSTQAYNKTSSFFDNISSEAKDRLEAQEDRINGRQMRNEEYKKNLDTFGQGNVDSGGYRGRGRGRGYRGGYNRGYHRGYGGGARAGFDGVSRGRGRGGANASGA